MKSLRNEFYAGQRVLWALPGRFIGQVIRGTVAEATDSRVVINWDNNSRYSYGVEFGETWRSHIKPLNVLDLIEESIRG